MRFLRELEFGAVSVNSHAPMASEMPHGGFGSSGYGKDLGTYGLEEYTRVKHIAHGSSSALTWADVRSLWILADSWATCIS